VTMAEARFTHGRCVTCKTWQPIKRLWGSNLTRLYAHGGCPGANQLPEAFVDLPGLADELKNLRIRMAIVESFSADVPSMAAEIRSLRTAAEVHEQTSRRAERAEQKALRLQREVNAKYDETSLGRDVKQLRGLYDEACVARDKAEQQRAETHRLLQDAHDASDKLAEQVIALTAQLSDRVAMLESGAER
jgi:hypothetical protein